MSWFFIFCIWVNTPILAEERGGRTGSRNPSAARRPCSLNMSGSQIEEATSLPCMEAHVAFRKVASSLPSRTIIIAQSSPWNHPMPGPSLAQRASEASRTVAATQAAFQIEGLGFCSFASPSGLCYFAAESYCSALFSHMLLCWLHILWAKRLLPNVAPNSW